jgi:hypothetical protein
MEKIQFQSARTSNSLSEKIWLLFCPFVFRVPFHIHAIKPIPGLLRMSGAIGSYLKHAGYACSPAAEGSWCGIRWRDSLPMQL